MPSKLGFDNGRPISAHIEGRNLFDEAYIARASVIDVANSSMPLFEQGPGRAVYAGIKVQLVIRRREVRSLILGASAAWAVFAGMPTVTRAHVSLQTPQARVGAPYRAVMRVPHGCDGAATTKIRVVIPEGIIAVKPMPKPGWKLEIVRGPYANRYKYYHGKMLTEGPKGLIWSGELLDEHYDEFVFSAMVAGSLAAGESIYFPVHQECGAKVVSWNEVPGPGRKASDLKTPAAALALIAAPGPATFKVGSLVIETPWIRATPGGARVAGGYLKITNTGQQPDRLIGGTLPIATDVEVHEMTMVDSMMKMRRLSDGLEIKAGVTIELKPGSYHLMFMGLSNPIAEGQVHKGTLRFEKAGSVDVSFQVAPVGARSVGTDAHH